MSVRYRLVVAKKDERVEGPDDADVTFTIPAADADVENFEATVAYMRGRLKAIGHTGLILDALKSGDADSAIARLVAAI